MLATTDRIPVRMAGKHPDAIAGKSPVAQWGWMAFDCVSGDGVDMAMSPLIAIRRILLNANQHPRDHQNVLNDAQSEPPKSSCWQPTSEMKEPGPDRGWALLIQ